MKKNIGLFLSFLASAVFAGGADAASSVRAFGSSVYPSASNAAGATGSSAINTARSGTMRALSSFSTSGTPATSTTTTTNTPTTSAPRLSIGSYLQGSSHQQGGSTILPQIPDVDMGSGGGSVDLTDIQNQIDNIESDINIVESDLEDSKDLIRDKMTGTVTKTGSGNAVINVDVASDGGVEVEYGDIEAVITDGSIDIDKFDTNVTDILNKAETSVQPGDLNEYVTQTEMNTELADKQNVLSAGTGITISNDVISATGVSVDLSPYATIVDMEAADATKQDVLTAGTGIDITGNVISSTATGSGINDVRYYNSETNEMVGLGSEFAEQTGAVSATEFDDSTKVLKVNVRDVADADLTVDVQTRLIDELAPNDGKEYILMMEGADQKWGELIYPTTP